MARNVNGIDLALGTHVGNVTPEPALVNGTIIAVAGPDELQALGQLDLTIRDGRVIDFAFRRHIPEDSGPIDKKVEAAVAKYLPQE